MAVNNSTSEFGMLSIKKEPPDADQYRQIEPEVSFGIKSESSSEDYEDGCKLVICESSVEDVVTNDELEVGPVKIEPPNPVVVDTDQTQNGNTVYPEKNNSSQTAINVKKKMKQKSTGRVESCKSLTKLQEMIDGQYYDPKLFGNYIASELRSLKSQKIRRKVKSRIRAVIKQAVKEDRAESDECQNE